MARRWKLGETIAIPTECTYEVGMRLAADDWSTGLDRLRSMSDGGGDTHKPEHPHIYVTCASLLGSCTSSTRFLQTQLPERNYAFRKDGKILSLHSFSESMQVLKRLAAKVWPGPVVLHVAIPPPSRASSPSVSSVSSSPILTSTAAPTTTTTANTTTKDGSQQYLALRCPCHPLSVKVFQEYYRSEDDVLVGMALSRSSSYVTNAGRIASGPSAVLHGEEELEMFAVPTCEYGQPWPVTVWIDEERRTIVIRRREDCSVEQSSGRPALTPESLMQALLTNKSKMTKKDRVVAAVLSKWVVGEE